MYDYQVLGRLGLGIMALSSIVYKSHAGLIVSTASLKSIPPKEIATYYGVNGGVIYIQCSLVVPNTGRGIDPNFNVGLPYRPL